MDGHAQFLNYWNVRLNASYSPRAMSRSATRGGPMMVDPGSTSFSVNVSSDRRKTVSFGANFRVSDELIGSGGGTNLSADVRIQPSDNLSLSLRPTWDASRTDAQYVRTSSFPYAATYDRAYLFAELERRSFAMVTRLDWTFSPTLSLQLFAQPLLSSGDYVQYKQLAEPASYNFVEMRPGTATVDGEVVRCSSNICEVDGRQYVDYDGDGVADDAFTDRDFNVRSLVGNAVLRWEYRPGSTVFFVWQRRQSDFAAVGDFALGRDTGALFGAPADNRFIVKVNYWLGL